MSLTKASAVVNKFLLATGLPAMGFPVVVCAAAAAAGGPSAVVNEFLLALPKMK